MRSLIVLIATLSFISPVWAAQTKQEQPFTGPNYSGTYTCKGENQKVGNYRINVTLRLNLVSSHQKFGAYEYTAETENSVKFYGNAVAVGSQLAASYYLDTLKRSKDEPTTALATIKREPGRRWSFRSAYFEPDDFGGNYGTEVCVMDKPKAAPKKAG